MNYNPEKQYKWEETDEFVLNGKQFGLILNACRNLLLTEQAQITLTVASAEAELTKLLSKAIEQGKVKEVLPGS